MTARDRQDPETEHLLWQLAGLGTPASAQSSEPPIEDEEIERYRRGELPAAERRRFEERLALDGRGMERLARVVTRPAPRRQPAFRLAASILVGALAIAGLFFSLRPGGVQTAVSGIPPYTVAVSGLADRRSAGPQASYAALPGSMVRVVARPAKTPAPDLQFTLYRLESDVLDRIPDTTIRIQVQRGTAMLEAEAEALLGSAPGLHELVLLITPAGGFEPPSNIARSALGDLILERGLQAHHFEIRLLPTSGSESRTGRAPAPSP